MWRTVKLGDVCELVGGGTPSKRNPKFYDGTIPWATVRDMYSEYLDGTECYITEEGLASSSSKVISSGNVIIASRVGLGKVCLLKHDTAINQDLRGVIPRNGNELDTKYLFYWFKSVAEKIITAGRGATVQGVTLPFLNALELPIPPLAEQQRIVAKLDATFAEIDSAINLVETKQANAEKLKASLLDVLLTSDDALWKTVKLGDVCKIVNGGTPKSDVKMYWEGDIQWLTPKDMGKIGGKYVELTERQITKDGLNNSSAKLVPANSVILSCRAPIGHVFINTIDMSFNQGCKGLVPTSEIITEYLYYFLFSSKQLLNDLGTGTTFKEISGKTLANVELLLPPLAEQQRIVAKLDVAFSEIETVFSTTKMAMNNYTVLKSSLLARELNPSEAA